MSHIEGSPGDVRNRHLEAIQTFVGGGGSSANLSRVYGLIEIVDMYGVVAVVLNADVDNISLDVFPAGGALVALAALVDSASAPVGSLFVKQTQAANALILKSAVVPYISEQADWRSPFISTLVGAEGDGTATYIRCTYSGVATNGEIHWHIDWKPESDNGHAVAV